jgi:hypothetical protein
MFVLLGSERKRKVSEKRCATKEKFSAVASSKLWVF